MRRRKTGRYGYKRIEIDGYSFQSTKEGRRYEVLRDLEQQGKISGLVLQQPFKIEMNGQKICVYKADFCYTENGEYVVEDVKSAHTAKDSTFILKKKLVKAVYDIDIKIVI